MTDALCIDCSTPLDDATPCKSNPHSVVCACGCRYTIEAIHTRDVPLWERARTERLFHRDNNTVWLTTPLERIRDIYPDGWSSSLLDLPAVEAVRRCHSRSPNGTRRCPRVATSGKRACSLHTCEAAS